MARVFAWSGALLFFASLAWFAFTYTVTWARPAAAGDAAGAITWNVLLFTVFAVHHSVCARARVRAAVARVFPDELERSAYVWAASLLFLGVLLLWRPVPGIAWQVDGVGRWVLWGLWLWGAGLTLRSAAILDIRMLAGLPSPTSPTRPIEYRAVGPYAWVRHPIYTGWFLLVLAVSPMTMTRLVFAAASCVYLLIGIQFEERSMRASPPGAYDRYMAQVRWRLLPWVW